MSELDDYRIKINKIDDEMSKLFVERMEVSKDIADYKLKHALPVYDENREKEVIEKNLATVQQIACTLGEHMAETEVLLRSIAKDYSSEINDRPNITIRNKKGKF